MAGVQGLQPVVDFINSHFELYGRKFVLLPFVSQSSKSTSIAASPEDQHADAVHAASLKPFAATDYILYDPNHGASNTLPGYLQTLASRRVITLTGGSIAPALTDQQLAGFEPHAWSYFPTVADLLEQAGHLICAQLAGHPATHAPAYATTTRKFALLLPDAASFGGDVPGRQELVARTGGCGAAKPEVVYYGYSASSQQGAASEQSALTEQMVRLRANGVTTLVYLISGSHSVNSDPMEDAAAASYQPEWLMLAPTILSAANVTGNPRVETRNSFGITGLNKLPALTGLPWYQSYLAGGGDGGAASSLVGGDGLYHELLMLASGVQNAGPHLTATTFGAALHRIAFPDPGAGTAPSYQAGVGFPAPGASMVRDFAEWWPDPTSNQASTTRQGLAEAADDWGSFCWVDLGARWADGTWPKRDHARSGRCR
jgi:hypothetical protein